MTAPEDDSKEHGAAIAKEPVTAFETALERLAAIVERLEDGDLSLDESLKLFEEGVRLARASQARLEAAEKRVEELLTVDEQGNPVVRELSTDK
jgi:exodeoxyribonuclease VII small subunit